LYDKWETAENEIESERGRLHAHPPKPGSCALVILLLPLADATPVQADSATIPPPVRAMLDAAMASGNANDVAAIAKYATQTSPETAPAITKLVADWSNKRHEQAQHKIREATLFELVKGRAELGGYLTDGNTQNAGIAATLDLKREGISWRHKLHLQVDYLRSAGVTTREHYLAAYEPNYRFSPRGYVYGSAQYESDRFLGYFDRFSTSVGAGYSAVKQKDMSLDLELGPAFRQTNFTNGNNQASAAARGSIDFGWKLTPAVSFRQNASAYLEIYNSTVFSKTALNAKLIGPLSAQLSYTLQFESDPPEGRRTTDTSSRASLVLDF
jgi:putative salt-induced outer membrane protein